MRRLVWVLGLFALCAACPAVAQPQAAAPAALAEVTGYVSDGARDKAGLWFRLTRVDERFVIRASDGVDPDRLFEVLQEASKSGNSVGVRYDPTTGVFDRADPKVPTFTVRELVYFGHPFAGEPAGARAGGVTRLSPAQARLAEGLAWGIAGDFARARPALDAALQDRLPSHLRILALKTRGNLLSDEASATFASPTRQADELLVAALADFRAWRAAAPRDSEASYALAGALRDLGAYEEALEAFRRIGVDWPEEGYWSAIRVGAVHRLRGEFDKALANLDAYAAREGTPNGMPFHYHRGWTLTELGRYDEAVSEFTKGMEAQPDYSWAFERRACAFAKLGRPKDAIADHEAAQREFHATAALTHNPVNLQIIARADAVGMDLAAAVARGPQTVSDGPCHGYPDWSSDPRPRSPLIPPRF